MSSHDRALGGDRRRRFVVLLLTTLALVVVVFYSGPLFRGDDTAVLGRSESRDDPEAEVSESADPEVDGRGSDGLDDAGTAEPDPTR